MTGKYDSEQRLRLLGMGLRRERMRCENDEIAAAVRFGVKSYHFYLAMEVHIY